MSETRPLSPDEIERNIHRSRAQIDDTLDRLQQKLSPGELVNHAMHFARENGSSLVSNSAEMAGNVGRTARDNPIPLALLGVGLAWLMVGERRKGNSRRFPRDPGATGSGRAGDMAQAAGDRASEAAGAERAGDIGEGIGETARATRRFATDYPLATGAVMLAAGAVLAALLPSSRAEDRWMGERSDVAREGAGRKAAEMADRAATATAEAEEKGLTVERAKKEAVEAAEAAGEVAVSAAEAARREFRGNSGSEHKGNDPSAGSAAPDARQGTAPQKS